MHSSNRRRSNETPLKMAGNRFDPLSGLSKSPPEPPSPLTQPPPQASGSSPQQKQQQQEQQQEQQQQQSQAPNQRPGKKRRNHRGGKKKRRKSFAILDDDDNHPDNETTGAGLYQIPAANISETSLESEALLDHRFVACHHDAVALPPAPTSRADEAV